jgi:hypothetical protein
MDFGDYPHIPKMPAKRASPETPPTEPRVYPIDLRTQTPYEAGALLLVLIAFPNESEEELAKFHAALCASALTMRAKTDVDWATAFQTIKPVHFSMPPNIAKRRLRRIEHALDKRLTAGHIANALIFKTLGCSVKLPKDCERFTLKQLIKAALRDQRYDAENDEQRVWRASLPAIHLAAALQAYLNLPAIRQAKVSWHDIIFDTDALYWIAARAIENWHVIQDSAERSLFGKHRPILLLPVVPADFKEIDSS